MKQIGLNKTRNEETGQYESKVSTQEVVEDYKKGMLKSEIAKKHNVTLRCVATHLDKAGALQLEIFKKGRADELAEQQRLLGKAGKLITEAIIDKNKNGKKLSDESYFTLGVLASRIATARGIYQDKERLERGESTGNVHIIYEAITELQKKRAQGKT